MLGVRCAEFLWPATQSDARMQLAFDYGVVSIRPSRAPGSPRMDSERRRVGVCGVLGFAHEGGKPRTEKWAAAPRPADGTSYCRAFFSRLPGLSPPDGLSFEKRPPRIGQDRRSRSGPGFWTPEIDESPAKSNEVRA